MSGTPGPRPIPSTPRRQPGAAHPEDPCTQSSRPAASSTASKSARSSRSSSSTSSRVRRSPSSACSSWPTATPSAIGRPVVDGAKVTAEVLRRERGVKTISFKYRPKARRRVKKGHRQELTILRVDDIVLDGKSAAKEVRAAEAAARTERQRLEEAAARQAAEDAGPRREARQGRRAQGRGEAAPAKGRAAKKTATDEGRRRQGRREGRRQAGRQGRREGRSAKAEAAKAGKTAKPSADAPKKAARTKKDE